MSFTLTNYELYLLLAKEEAKYFLGSGFSYLPPKEERAAFEQALDSLKEKGYLVSQDDQLSLSPELVKPIEICAVAHDVLIVAYHIGGMEPGIRLYYFSEQGVVEVRILQSSYRLKEIVAFTKVLPKIKTLFHLQAQQAVPGEPCTLASSALETIHESVEKGKEKIALQLQQAGAGASIAYSLADAFVAPVSNSTLTKVRVEEETTAESFVLLESAEGLLEMHFSRERQVHLNPVDAETAIQMIASYFL